MTMIERVARAIADANQESFDDMPDLHIALARAAIEAMREPSRAERAMEDAGLRTKPERTGSWIEGCKINDAYRAMTAAALEEGK